VYTDLKISICCFIRMFYAKLCGTTEISPFIKHPHDVDGTRRLYLLFDTTHNLKNMFNNWLNKSRFALPDGFFDVFPDHTVADFKNIRALYAKEENKTVKMAFALKSTSLRPNSIARTSPQHALG